MMREADFAALLHLVERLSLEQRTALGRALAAASGESEAIRLLAEAFLAAPRCRHCAAAALQRWGYASGLRRYRARPAARPPMPCRHLPGAAAQEGMLA